MTSQDLWIAFDLIVIAKLTKKSDTVYLAKILQHRHDQAQNVAKNVRRNQRSWKQQNQAVNLKILKRKQSVFEQITLYIFYLSNFRWSKMRIKRYKLHIEQLVSNGLQFQDFISLPQFFQSHLIKCIHSPKRSSKEAWRSSRNLYTE